ncbi:MAG: group II intron maturase-specific domain-containing protein [Acidiferrobacteraceae bacterium]
MVTSEELDLIPASIRVLQHQRTQYACACGQCIWTAPMPARPIPKSMCAPGLLAHIVVSKYQDALPLYRQEQILARIGVMLFYRVYPGASKKAMKAMTKTIRSWRIHRSSGMTIEGLARAYNAILRGWINYYGRYWYRHFGYRIWSCFQSRLVRWTKCRYRISQRQAERKLNSLRKQHPNLFAHWQLLGKREEYLRAV